MEKRKNGYFKAVSILSLISGILFAIALVLFIIGSIVGIDLILEAIVAEIEGAGLTGYETLASGELVSLIVVMCIYMAGYVALSFVAFAKLKKYTYLTNEEAQKYNGKIIAWIVVMFLFCGTILGIIMLLGYLNVTKVQIDQLNLKACETDNEVLENNQVNESTDTKDLDLMMERLEKLNKIKEMGGLTDEEYETLRKKIVDNK